MSDTPIARLRALHKEGLRSRDGLTYPNRCAICAQSWPCDTIAALDALEVEGRDIQFRMFELQTRLDAATKLIRKFVADDDRVHEVWSTPGEECEYQPFREWLAGDKEEHGE